jgi:hypothetical protein
MERDRAERHKKAARTQEEAVVRHEKAASFLDERGDDARADLERRNAAVEHEAAQLERERAALEADEQVGRRL